MNERMDVGDVARYEQGSDPTDLIDDDVYGHVSRNVYFKALEAAADVLDLELPYRSEEDCDSADGLFDDYYEGQPEDGDDEGDKVPSDDEEEDDDKWNAAHDVTREEQRRRLKIQIFEEFQRGATQAELREKYSNHFSRTLIHRIVHGQGRFDGSEKAGRSSSLSLASELALAAALRTLLSLGISLTMSEVSVIARKLWALEGGYGEVPRFGRNWRAGFNRRHPHLKLELVRVRPKTVARSQASTLPRVAKALNGYKNHINGKLARSVFVMDELDVSANDKGVGGKRVAVGASKPFHSPPNNTPHVTACPFISLAGTVRFVAYVVPTTRGTEPIDDLANVLILSNATGSVLSSDGRDGQVMSTMGKIAFGFVQACRRAMHPEWPALTESDFWAESLPSSYDLDVTLIVDGFAAHEEPATSKFLFNNGVKLLELPANLTHLIQIGDMSSINGRIQGTVRKVKSLLSSKSATRLSVGAWITFVHNALISQVGIGPMMDALATLGIKYDEGFEKVIMTNETIDNAMAKMLKEGKVSPSDPFDSEDRMVLRGSEYIEASTPLAQTKKKQRTEDLARMMCDIKDAFILDHGGVPALRKVRGYQRRGPKRLKVYGLRPLNDPKRLALHAAESKEQEKKAHISEQRRLERAKSKQAKALAHESRAARLKELQDAFPGVELTPYLKNVSRYLSGSASMTIERAKERLNELLGLKPPISTTSTSTTSSAGNFGTRPTSKSAVVPGKGLYGSCLT